MKCPNCGQEFEGHRCPNCGRPRAQVANRVAAIVVLVLLVLPAALVGGCSVVVGLSGIDRANYAGDLAFTLIIGGGAFAVCAGFFYVFLKLWKG